MVFVFSCKSVFCRKPIISHYPFGGGVILSRKNCATCSILDNLIPCLENMERSVFISNPSRLDKSLLRILAVVQGHGFVFSPFFFDGGRVMCFSVIYAVSSAINASHTHILMRLYASCSSVTFFSLGIVMPRYSSASANTSCPVALPIS